MAKTPFRVLWTEGMMVTPQHMQQQDLYHERSLQARLLASDPLSWGLIDVEIDATALQGGTVKVTSLEAVLPDGSVIAAGAGDVELPPSRPMDGHFPATSTSLDVHVALARERSGVPSTGTTKGRTTRFVRTERSVVDLQQEAEARELAFAQHNPVILFGDERREDYVSIKVAELVRDDSNQPMISEPYVAPCLRIAASPFIMSGVRRVFTAMRTRRAALVEAQREREGSTVEYNAADVGRFLLVNAINSYLPVLRYLSDAGDQHPRGLYLTLAQFAGELTSFSSDTDPAELPSFVFTDLRHTFEGLFAKILSLLHATLKESFISLDLDARSDGMHVGALTDARWATTFDCFLAVSSNTMTGANIGRELPRLAKVASWTDMNQILTAASCGAAAEVVFSPPPQLPVRANNTYFRLNTQSDFWRNVATDKQVAVYLPLPFAAGEGTSVRLLGILR